MRPGLPQPPLYLVTPSTPTVRAFVEQGILGQLSTPDIGNALVPGATWAADNGCFSKRWTAEKWSAWLSDAPRTALWATVPDVVGDHAATLARWETWAPFVVALGHRPAFVAQDGCTPMSVPSDAGAVFLGGSTEFKLSPTAEAITRRSKERGIPVHMGRVNSRRRYLVAREWGVDTVDGTYLAFGPDVNLPRLTRWIYETSN